MLQVRVAAVTASDAIMPKICADLTVVAPRSVRFRIGTSTLSPPVASVLRGDTCAAAATDADAWLRAGVTLPSALPHGDAIATAFDAAATDSSYQSFVVASALIERVLNDLCVGDRSGGGMPVSYTHLTLPTILLV